MAAKTRCAAAFLAAGLLTSLARANDSAAERGAGGLVLRREPGIVLVSADLSIASDRISVTCLFRNQVEEPRTVRIAFPLLPIEGRELSFSALALPQPDSPGFVGFTLTVDRGSPEAVVSFCRTDIRKTGPTTFRWEARDYVPDQDLRVLFVQPDPGTLVKR
ncbi:DUF4424 domain-containing protein [Methylobacterium sp. P1-11]|uniref:DUF4424 family protein n=1 Tax=Methylobacterium sp. P1-11 TaxID=2024616 RepID=UPI0011EC8BBA|nr:DUF4424 family protein [Methylobacterium sp. P1-11]KAA0122897.1 DUF4424 domain-containing protein [Methylobacterium sp. P1-11]